MGFFFGFEPKKKDTLATTTPARATPASTTDPLQKSIEDMYNKLINENKPEEKKPIFRVINQPKSSDVDLNALLKMLSVINAQLKQDEQNGIYIESFYHTKLTIQQLTKEKHQIETIRKIILDSEPPEVESILMKLTAKIEVLTQTLPTHSFGR